MRFLAFSLLAFGCTTNASSDPFSSDTTEIAISRTGGLAPTPAAGSTCAPMDDRYTLTVASHILAWQFCAAPANDQVYSPVPGQRTLSDAQFEQVTTSLHGLTGPQPGCGGDLIDQIVFTTPTTHTTLDRANCLGNEGAVFELLDGLAQ